MSRIIGAATITLGIAYEYDPSRLGAEEAMGLAAGKIVFDANRHIPCSVEEGLRVTSIIDLTDI